jgi:hypothetical protein
MAVGLFALLAASFETETCDKALTYWTLGNGIYYTMLSLFSIAYFKTAIDVYLKRRPRENWICYLYAARIGIVIASLATGTWIYLTAPTCDSKLL